MEFARHAGPSTIGLDTLAKSGGRIPRKFLVDAGVAAPLIDAQDKIANVDRKFPTVLTIGSVGDGEFAGRIRDCLLAAQIPCWGIEADDETRLQSHEIILDHSVYFDCLVPAWRANSRAMAMRRSRFSGVRHYPQLALCKPI